MQLFPIELAFENLKRTIPEDTRGFMAREDAYEWLKELSGQDFTIDDIQAWTNWVRSEMERIPSKFDVG